MLVARMVCFFAIMIMDRVILPYSSAVMPVRKRDPILNNLFSFTYSVRHSLGALNDDDCLFVVVGFPFLRRISYGKKDKLMYIVMPVELVLN